MGYTTYRTISALNSTSLIGIPFLPLKLATHAVTTAASTLGSVTYHGTGIGASLGWKGAKLGAKVGYKALRSGMSIGEGAYGWWSGTKGDG